MIIHQWITSLITQSDCSALVRDFTVEDGMNWHEYYSYELDNFQSLSGIFDLDINFTVETIYQYSIGQGRVIHFIYIRNSQQKIVCKMNITVLDNAYISSNGFYSQIVPKHALLHDCPIELGIAIKGDIQRVKSPDTELIGLYRASHFDSDGFHSARFCLTHKEVITFYVQMGSIEKRKIYFDKIDYSLKPYRIEGDTLTLIDSAYPVHVAIYGDNYQEKAYPRNFSCSLLGADKIIVTDCLDNDWILRGPAFSSQAFSCAPYRAR